MDISNSKTTISLIQRLPGTGSFESAILRQAGYHVIDFYDSQSASAFLESNHCQLVLLDQDIEEQESMELVIKLRKTFPPLPIIIITSNGSLDTAIRSIQLGVRDYLVKPLAPDELLHCVTRVLSDYELHWQRNKIIKQTKELLKRLELSEWRTRPEEYQKRKHKILQRGQFTIDLNVQCATKNGQLISLSPTTFEYFATLARHSPRPVSYKNLVHEAQGVHCRHSKYRDIARWHVHKLRKTIEHDCSQPRHIVTVRGVGYCLIP